MLGVLQIKAKGYKRPRGVTTIEKYTDEELEAARSLLATEEVKVKEEMRVCGCPLQCQPSATCVCVHLPRFVCCHLCAHPLPHVRLRCVCCLLSCTG